MSTRATEAESVLKEHMGYLPVSEMERRGVSRTEISRFVREAKLEKAAKGLYVSPNAESDPLFELQYRYPKAIFSHETALFLLGEGGEPPPDTDDYLTAIIRYGSSQE
ncbi:type IV toxin-antitoxin system AbiEi family antitoxin domain-containing protein [Bifidobacterium longum]|uniref:type IV toxin-antitoxin system AbiEi family antitoxin domain-containing protein n=2 Tax=Bifidobacterium longum TaxID=216816 RepID=UPI003B9B46F4